MKIWAVTPRTARRTLGLVLGVIAMFAAATAGAFGGTGGGTITTIAGTGQWGYAGGDGGPGVSAELWLPRGVAADREGNVYVADTANNKVRKIDAHGIIRTIAGTGKAGFSGDGGAGRAARLDSPSAVAVDGQGDVYIADTSNLRVRKVNERGVITTIAGTGTFGPAGNNGPATKASLYQPVGVAVDSKRNVYIYEVDGDRRIGRVRKIRPDGTITAFAGTGKSGFSGDGGPAVSARLSSLGGVAADPAGNVYIADYGNQRVRKVDTRGTITTIAGTGQYGYSGDGGPATSARLWSPYGVAADGRGNVYIADFLNSRVRKVSRDRTITTIAGTGREGDLGDGGPATSAQLFRPEGVAVDVRGNVYVADTHNNRVRKVSTGPEASGTAERRAFYSPSRNLFCDLAPSGVTCTSRTPEHRASMGLDGRVTICRGAGCIGNPGVVDPQPTPTLLPYGRQITVGRFRCVSLETGVRCSVIQSGIGFLISRAGVSRVGP